ncbi:MAG: XTP/dITP diphosphatase [Candidatus Eiseniibacteriota bacterium]
MPGAAPRRLLLATRNAGKVRELRALLQGLTIELVGLDAVEPFPEVEETGETFADNALLKARAAVRASGLPAVADDSGLCVDALDGAPGVRSARFAGGDATDADNNHLLLERLADFDGARRTARFVCVAALVLPDGRETLFEGEVEGRILRAPRGQSGFGYDPLFYYEPFGSTFAEATAAAKNRVSHRARAFGQLVAHLRGLIGAEEQNVKTGPGKGGVDDGA